MVRVRERGEEVEEFGSVVKEVVIVVIEGVRKFG